MLTGRSNFALLDKITQSLAGRNAIFNLLPFSIDEIRKHNLLVNEMDGVVSKTIIYDGETIGAVAVNVRDLSGDR